VLVTIEYRIDDADRAAFQAQMRALGTIRRRDGAVVWGVVEDVATPGIHLEYFVTPSWLEHLRQHERITADDRAIQEVLRALHRGERAPVVRHFVGGHDPLPPLCRITTATSDQRTEGIKSFVHKRLNPLRPHDRRGGGTVERRGASLRANANRSALNCSAWVTVRPCGAPAYTFSSAFLMICEDSLAEASNGTIWSSSPCTTSAGTSIFFRSSV
jgi:hypothetical protein